MADVYPARQQQVGQPCRDANQHLVHVRPGKRPWRLGSWPPRPADNGGKEDFDEVADPANRSEANAARIAAAAPNSTGQTMIAMSIREGIARTNCHDRSVWPAPVQASRAERSVYANRGRGTTAHRSRRLFKQLQLQSFLGSSRLGTIDASGSSGTVNIALPSGHTLLRLVTFEINRSPGESPDSTRQFLASRKPLTVYATVEK